jgi:hypothetical protein
VGVWQSVMSMPAEAYSDDIYIFFIILYHALPWSSNKKVQIGRSSTSSSSPQYSSCNSSPQSHFHLQFHSDTTTHPILGLPLNWACIFTSSKFLVWVLSRVGRWSSLAG